MSPEKKNDTAASKSGGKKAFMPETASAEADSLTVQDDDPIQQRYFRRSVMLIGGAFLVMLFFFLAAFFLAVRGAERTVVPQVVSEELPEALIILQERELYPRLQLKFTGDPSDKGKVISQDPEPGLYVKAGRRVTITVSQGAIVDKVEDYVGMTVSETRSRLASLFSTFEPLLLIREPVTYVYNEAETGTILSQTPEPGTPLGDPQELILVASRGVQDRAIILPDFDQYNADNAMRALARMGLPFYFQEASVAPVGYVARVTGQSPAPESEITTEGRVRLLYSKPEAWPEDSEFGVFEFELPEYAVPVLLEVVIREPGAEDRMLFSMPHPGGLLSFPYVLPEGSAVIISANGRETARHDVISAD